MILLFSIAAESRAPLCFGGGAGAVEDRHSSDLLPALLMLLLLLPLPFPLASMAVPMTVLGSWEIL